MKKVVYCPYCGKELMVKFRAQVDACKACGRLFYIYGYKTYKPKVFKQPINQAEV